jgi:hypothetical protein
MNRLIIFIVSGILLLAGGARAEEIYLNCKFVRGHLSSNEPNFISENMNKNSEFANDIGISLNLKNKKIIYLTDAYKLNTPEILQVTIAIIEWSEKNIIFTYSPTDYAKYTYNLDRLSGNLKRIIDMITDTQRKIKVTSSAECLKQNKKF